MIKTYGWLITIIASLLAAAIGGFIVTDERLVRVEENQKYLIKQQDQLILELDKHEKETQKSKE